MRFRKIALQCAPDQSEALKMLLDLWEKNKDELSSNAGNFKSHEILLHIDKCTNRVVGIIRNIENEKINHIHGMMQSLFTAANSEQPRTQPSTKKSYPSPDPLNGKYKDTYTMIELNHTNKTLEWEIRQLKKEIYEFLDTQITQVQPKFGKPRLEISLDLEEINALKTKYYIEE